MKKFTLSLISSILILIFSIPALGAVPLLGDLNNDGKADLADVVLMLQAMNRTDTAGQAGGLEKADFNVDGRIGMEEALFILQAIAGLREIAVPVALRTGTVLLPDGWPAGVPLTDLVVCGELGSSAVGGDGSFAVPLSGEGDALAVVTNAAGTALMMGYLTEGSGQNILGAESTAVALLFQAMDLYTQPPSAWAGIRELIAATSEAATLSARIAERLAADPEAIVKGDAAVADALLAAVNAIAASGAAGSQLTSAVAARTFRSPQSGDVTHVRIDGANPRSGVNIERSPDGLGITARNEFRRHVLVLVYRTGWEDRDGVKHDTPWELIASGPFSPVAKGAYLGATNAVGGVVTSLIDWYTGNGAYTPSSWDTDHSIPLPMSPGVDPESIAKTFYRIVCVGDYLGYEPLPGDLMPVAGEVKKAQETMQALEFFKEFLLPLIFAVIPGDKIAGNLALDKNYVEAAIDIVNFVSSMIPDVGTNIAAGQYKNAVWAVVKAFASNQTLHKKTAMLFVKWGLVKGLNAATQASIAETSKKVMEILQIADKVIAAFDQSVLMTHLANSHPYEQWDATALWPPVRVQPKPATVEAGKNVQLMVTVDGETGNSDKYFYKFTWTTTGVHGKIVNPVGPAPPGMEIVMTSRSPGARIKYESASDAAPGDEDHVQVVVHRVGAGGTLKLGDDQTTVKVSGSSVELDPATADVEPGGSQVFTSIVKPEKDESQGDVYYYRWENSAQYGHLSGGSDAFESTTVTSVTYQASADKEGVDSLSLSVYRERPGSERELLGIASSMVNVRKPYAVQLTPQGKKLAFGGSQVYTATLVPEPEAGTELIYTWSNTATAGTLTGTGGTDHFEQSGNQATYRAGQEIGTDTISVKVERVSGGERFLMAEASTAVTVARYTIVLPATYELNWGTRTTVTPVVKPSIPAGGYFKWTNTGTKGTLTDTAGHSGNFETTKTFVYYRASSDVPDGVDTVRVELYTSDGTLQGNAETAIAVSGPVDVPISVVSGHVKYEEEDPAYTAAIYFGVYGTVMMTCVQPVQCSGPPDVEIDTHGVDDFALVTNYPPKLLSHYEGWQTVDWGGGMTNRCLPDETSPQSRLHCQLAPTGVLANWLVGWGTKFGYPISEPSWREQTMQQRDNYIAATLPTLSVYNSWSYRGTCWKRQKFN